MWSAAKLKNTRFHTILNYWHPTELFPHVIGYWHPCLTEAVIRA
jgi:hypothetical protein